MGGPEVLLGLDTYFVVPYCVSFVLSFLFSCKYEESSLPHLIPGGWSRGGGLWPPRVHTSLIFILRLSGSGFLAHKDTLVLWASGIAIVQG